ncbi:MAG TPA: hydrogen peroxide-dependent heme synthase [Solirubrobacteraceae bacterium]|nr:hydrogen peroxide-dependent heme synthase [Solirubrobacteraceae bacterium]
MASTAQEPVSETATAFPAGLLCTSYASYRLAAPLGDAPRQQLAAEVTEALAGVQGVALRGVYDTAAMRVECDLLIWLAAPTIEALQEADLAVRRTRLGALIEPFWKAVGVYRDAEFSRSHKPAFYAGEPARNWLCVYPFVRTHDWYLLDAARRRELLVEHGVMGRDFPDVRANTVSAFGLGDYEWLLAFEADDLGRIVDLIRHLRAAEARRYTKEELPFITGVRRPLEQILGELP